MAREAGAATGLEKSEKHGVQAARNGPSEDSKYWQRVELGIHGLRSWGRNWSGGRGRTGQYRATPVLWTEVTDEELALAEDLPEGRQLDAVFAGPGEPRIGEDELELDDLEGVREFDLGVAPE
jgi:hypothetical protein